MRSWWVLAIFLFPGAGAVPVEMLFHHAAGLDGVIHPDGQRVAPPELFPAGDCPFAAGAGAKVFGGAFTVDPASQQPDGTWRYWHGDHGFGHGFHITDDAEITLPFTSLPSSTSLVVEATWYQGEYHLAWHGPDPDEVEFEERMVASWEGMASELPSQMHDGTQVHTVALNMPTGGTHVAIDEGVWLQVEIRSELSCDPTLQDVAFYAGEEAWPAIAFDITDHAEVRAAQLQVSEDGVPSVHWSVQHWRGVAGVDPEAFTVTGPGGQKLQHAVYGHGNARLPEHAYHHGIQAVAVSAVLPGLPDGDGGARIQLMEGNQTIVDYQGLTWTVEGGEVVGQCGREAIGFDREEGFADVCQASDDEQTTPMPVLAVIIGLALALRRR